MSRKRMLVMLVICVTSFCVFSLTSYSGIFLKKSGLWNTSCTCQRASEGDSWFTQHFNRSAQPFLTANYSLPDNDFKWWKHLQNEKRNFSFYTATIDKLFKMVPPVPDVGPSPGCCRSCAVVGNSINLKRSHYGPLIDAHDFVIRMNAGRIKGYEADVGSRTTHRVMYPESATDLDNTTHLVLLPFKIMDLEWLIKAFTTGFSGRSYVVIRSNIVANKDMVMVVNPAFMKYVQDSWLQKNGTYPSTGFISLFLALHMCDEVSVFGYGADQDGSWSHYWDKTTRKNFKTGIHFGGWEYEIIQKLAEKQILDFYKQL